MELDIMDDRSITMGFSERLKQAREQAGLSQTQAARLLNGSRSNIWRWETGNPEMSAETLRRVAEIYDVSTDWLLTGKGGLSDDELEQMSIQAARTNISVADFDKLIYLLQMLKSEVVKREINCPKCGKLMSVDPSSWSAYCDGEGGCGHWYHANVLGEFER